MFLLASYIISVISGYVPIALFFMVVDFIFLYPLMPWMLVIIKLIIWFWLLDFFICLWIVSSSHIIIFDQHDPFKACLYALLGHARATYSLRLFNSTAKVIPLWTLPDASFITGIFYSGWWALELFSAFVNAGNCSAYSFSVLFPSRLGHFLCLYMDINTQWNTWGITSINIQTSLYGIPSCLAFAPFLHERDKASNLYLPNSVRLRGSVWVPPPFTKA